MEVVDGWPALPSSLKTVVALGNFDGVHLGHQTLIRSAIARSKNLGAPAIVLTLQPHPFQLFDPLAFPGYITSRQEKINLLSQLGVDKLIFCPFTRDLARMPAEQFITQELWQNLHPLAVGVGFNYTFGYQSQGNPALLSFLGEKIGFEVFILPPVQIEGMLASSSVIREALKAGKIELARKFLGRWPRVYGRVGKGEQRGRELGFPTANLEVPGDLILPAPGVYAALARWEEEERLAVVNLGRRPTFGEGLKPTLEAHLLDFTGELYEKEMELEFRLRLREERAFPGPEELAKQIKLDVAAARENLTKETKF